MTMQFSVIDKPSALPSSKTISSPWNKNMYPIPGTSFYSSVPKSPENHNGIIQVNKCLQRIAPISLEWWVLLRAVITSIKTATIAFDVKHHT